ncbi:MAG: twin-arginine translocation signal domain-containing protein [Caldilineaceae bacterium]|nr:twin-arginine translocation signal domain-containing protein [Caldilineaceae bacterium]
MSAKTPQQSEMKVNYDISRRDFLRLSGLAAVGVVATACGTPPAPGSEADPNAAPADTASSAAPTTSTAVADVPRDKTLIVMFGGTQGQFTDVGLGNPYATGASHQMGSAALWEPLYFYSAFADEHIPWLAESYEYNDDYTELTVKIRSGVEWSDGTPFTANDVAFTLNMLQTNGLDPDATKLSNSTEVAKWIQETSAVDDSTVRIVFFEPRPRFMFSHLSAKFDTCIKIVPEHIFKDVEDVATFQEYDPAAGLPVCTGPYKITAWTAQQKFIDRRDDWWAVKTGFVAELPAVERILVLPIADETTMAQMVINNEIDSVLDLRAATIKQVVAQNEKIITHTGRELPLGYIDWWPTSFWFNCDEGAFADKNVRWAVSYTINREQMLEVALEGSGILTPLPFPQYAGLEPFFEAAKPLLEKYNTMEHNLDKAAEHMAAAGYEKDSEGFWVKDGARISDIIGGWTVFADIGPVLAEQLRQGGFDLDFQMPADHGTQISEGREHIWLNGHGGSINDPFDTLDMYTSKYYQPVGTPTTYNSRWRNTDYDAILEEMAKVPKEDAGYMDLYLQALEIFLDELPDCPIQQWLHRIPYNQTYWTGWPTQDDPYVNGAFWALTFPLILQHLKPAA